MITASDFISRRQNLFSVLPNKNATVVIAGRQPFHRIPTVPYTFDQTSDMIYFSGYDRPGGYLVIQNHAGEIRSSLYLPPPDKRSEIWNGFRTCFEDAKKISGVDNVYPESEFSKWLSHHSVHFSSGFNQGKSLAQYSDAVRFFKSPKEIALIEKASSITVASFNKALKHAVPGKKENIVAAAFQFYSAELGGTGLAYPTVCASGRNALCLHYLENSSIMKEGDALMMDAGAEFNHYASDFTRTVPIGKIEPRRQAIIDMVEDVKDLLVTKAKRGQALSLFHFHEMSQIELIKGLKECGVKVDMQGLDALYPHGVSHFIGLDVHDCDTVGGDVKLGKGSVFSCEPGLYFQMDNKDVPKELLGLGVRFEDTVILK